MNSNLKQDQLDKITVCFLNCTFEKQLHLRFNTSLSLSRQTLQCNVVACCLAEFWAGPHIWMQTCRTNSEPNSKLCVSPQKRVCRRIWPSSTLTFSSHPSISPFWTSDWLNIGWKNWMISYPPISAQPAPAHSTVAEWPMLLCKSKKEEERWLHTHQPVPRIGSTTITQEQEETLQSMLNPNRNHSKQNGLISN